MPRVVLKFSRKDDTTDQSYVALSRELRIKDKSFSSKYKFNSISFRKLRIVTNHLDIHGVL